ncbi:hypothetical protein OZX74_02590 [Bifidobacterium sp. ESL0798]|uniref:hypothetical protein n=1 Tax=Bifidobacterium sp. ESL0798 TaxID=2983235 RepID=UPI0023F9AD20|nr:hypothetical protein [Bifidobacterium sp. ESL0798]WEV74448.1 hypothetical protein OZX74_02590 [Bifidobacterium sp. ESL0798]
MSDESNEENEMTNPATDNDMIDTVAMPAQNGNGDTTETMPIQNIDTGDRTDIEAVAVQNGNDDATEIVSVQDSDVFADDAEDDDLAQNSNAVSDSSEAEESRAETETGSESEYETGVGTGSTTSDAPNQAGYVSPSNFANGPAPSGAYVRVPRDVPPRMPKPQPPAGPSKATIVLSLLPLFLGALMLFIGSASPMVFASIPGGVDVRSLIAMAIVMLGALLIVLAALLGLASLIQKGTAKWKARRRQ